MDKVSLKDKELDRIIIINQVKAGLLNQSTAGAQLGLSTRQVRRYLRRLEQEGTEGLKGRYKGGNRSFSLVFRESVLTRVRTKYQGFGPTLAREKLQEIDKLTVNKETLRQWMLEADLWKGRTRKKARIHQSRERRPRFGELIQIDGSHHDWFEGRGPKCCLLVFIDDATGRQVGLRFERQETTLGYMGVAEAHLMKWGRPVSYYADKHSIFRTTREESLDGLIQPTQLHRALHSLGIELICAHSSQAKGRVERANKTLQDRLVKELRLRNISTMETANQEARKLSKNLEISYEGVIYKIQTQTTGYRMRGKSVTMCKHQDGSLEILCDGHPLAYEVYHPPLKQRIADVKEINGAVDEIILGLDGFIPLPTGLHSPYPLRV